MPTSKTCTKCRLTKDLCHFSKHLASFTSRCKKCINSDRRSKKVNVNVISQKCLECNIVKKADNFYRDAKASTGLRSKCKSCYNKYMKSLYDDKTSTQWARRNRIRQDYKKAIKERHLKGSLQTAETKMCIRCRNQKTKEMFSRDLSSKDGLHCYCSKCDTYLRNKRYQKRYLNEHEQKVYQSLRVRMRTVILEKSGFKSSRTMKLLGAQHSNVIRKHIESLFKPGMSWNNYGPANRSTKTWQLDHVLPCNMFHLEDPFEQRRCFHYTNLQPLWSSENRTKSDNFTEDDDLLSSLYRLFDPELSMW